MSLTAPWAPALTLLTSAVSQEIPGPAVPAHQQATTESSSRSRSAHQERNPGSCRLIMGISELHDAFWRSGHGRHGDEETWHGNCNIYYTLESPQEVRQLQSADTPGDPAPHQAMPLWSILLYKNHPTYGSGRAEREHVRLPGSNNSLTG